MTIHIIHRSHQEADRTICSVSRVTVRSDLRLPVLIIDTPGRPLFEQVPMAKIADFWIEED
jgi:hypothetical protein